MTAGVSRREFFVVAIGAAGAVLQDTTSVGQVYDPERAGRAQAPVTAADNDKNVQALEKRLRCSCGCGLDIYTCRTTDFTCTYSPALHKQVLAMLGDGKSAQEVIDAFVAQYGQVALMSLPRRGFNLLGYFVPGVALLVAALGLVWMLKRWTRESGAAAPVMPAAPPDASPAELEQLRRELDRLPG
ncbi:MAG TPA: cytochrome c-type biogenesis protein CcmH [Gemmatimonadales bacterium]|nr:cytochrome c-type biogenesis protein CcmH [Gemmatimonadales bacterium]